jgi:hypothetical protein
MTDERRAAESVLSWGDLCAANQSRTASLVEQERVSGSIVLANKLLHLPKRRPPWRGSVRYTGAVLQVNSGR